MGHRPISTLVCAALVVCVNLGSPPVRGQQIGMLITVAGSSGTTLDPSHNLVFEPGYSESGDGGPAPRALLSSVGGVAVDPHGVLYFTDNERIRAVGPDGIIRTVIGTVGQRGFSGDGGPASQAKLSSPNHIAFDPAGNLFITDFLNYRVRKVSPSGSISTVAGNGTTFNAINGVIPQYTGDGGPAIQAGLGYPTAIAIDSQGDLLIAASWHIRKVTPDGIITTIAGSGLVYRDPETGQVGVGGIIRDGEPGIQADLGRIDDLALDNNDNLFMAESGQNRVLKLDARGIITTVAGDGGFGLVGDGGLATQATLNQPEGVAVDAAGNLWISDTGNQRIRKVTPDGIISTVVGNGTQNSADLGDGGPALAGYLHYPSAITIDARGNLYFGDALSFRVREVFGVAAPGLLAGAPLPPGATAFPLADDLNSDGRVDLNDVILSLRIAVGAAEASDVQKASGDLNKDGWLDIRDTTLLLRSLVGL